MIVAADYKFEDLIIGQRAEFEALISKETIDAFSDLSGDVSPLHIDGDFARERGYRDRVAHGAYLIALASRLVGMYLPGRHALLLAVETSFTAPVLPGTRVTVSGVIDQISDGVRSAILKLRVLDTDSRKTVARGRLTVGFTDTARPETSAYG